ncbi:LysR family transcriptional activator of glutamate synthase operon [Paenibacillus sp. V4I3]|uniref:LysR family transcriptional regulator n=1 Tax=Paenibacillus sp. V4I3 TaxID=3042305 RepID=UPI00277D73EC|nr:LysR family transcriptional regulator [Paenibacillus sp. V4I3]MDQ0874339.1 LysR family transcriptional activator of glutamate synthase operon [Paenibacillus sp. V4I3]
MELLQLEYFRTVARLEHMTEAAGVLHVTQSSLSKTIRLLEEDLGVSLFDRNSRKLRLNEFGRSFLQRVERALFELEEGKREIVDLTSADYGTLSLAVNTAYMLPDILHRFREILPHVQFHVQQLRTHEMEIWVKKGEVDFCLSAPPIQGSELVCDIVFQEQIYVIVPSTHRFANRDRVRLSELKEERFVSLKKGYGIRDLMDSYCEKVGFIPNNAYEGDEPASLGSLVQAGLGISFIPKTALYVVGHPGNIVPLKIEEPVCNREIGLSRHRSRYLSSAAKEFRQVVIEYFQRIAQNNNM